MKKNLLTMFYILVLVGCGRQSSDSGNITWYKDIITVVDNGTTYTDTTTWGSGGHAENLHEDAETDIEVLPGSNHILMTPKLDDSKTGKEDTDVIEPGFICAIHKIKDNTLFTLYYNSPSNHFPLSIVVNAMGPLSGMGIYKAIGPSNLGTSEIANTDTSLNKYYPKSGNSLFTETFSGGHTYKVDSAAVNITKAAGANVAGDFQLWISNAAGSKTVTGNINSHKARIY